MICNPRRALGAALGAILSVAPVSAVADASSETVTAQTHADLAAHASDLAGVHMHLHHTVNCIVGPGGTGFDAKELNPCANAGKGALPDSVDAAQKMRLTNAVAKAEQGISESSLSAAQKDAAATSALLKGQ